MATLSRGDQTAWHPHDHLTIGRWRRAMKLSVVDAGTLIASFSAVQQPSPAAACYAAQPREENGHAEV
jgi:hypothetical protein